MSIRSGANDEIHNVLSKESKTMQTESLNNVDLLVFSNIIYWIYVQ